ncbi:hypothetical protein GCM10023146_10610 [Nocardioides caricicola]
MLDNGRRHAGERRLQVACDLLELEGPRGGVGDDGDGHVTTVSSGYGHATQVDGGDPRDVAARPGEPLTYHDETYDDGDWISLGGAEHLTVRRRMRRSRTAARTACGRSSLPRAD